MAVILVPSTRNSIRADHLWRHTCFETFISIAGQRAYYEFNFSPDGRWAAYAFSAYRQAAQEHTQALEMALTPAPEIMVQRSPGRLQLNAILKPNALPPALRGATLDIGLSAVIETRETDTHAPQLSYWALHHPAERPDFHDRRAFALRLAPAASLENTTP